MIFRCLMLASLYTLAMLGPMPLATAQSPAGSDFIPYYGQPAIQTLPLNFELFQENWYQQVTEPALIYAEPGGNIISAFGPGLHTVTSMYGENGWTQINAGEWVQSAKLRTISVFDNTFRGGLLPEAGLEHPMGWLLFDVFPRGSAGGPHVGHPRINRYTALNIYDTVSVDGVNWHLIGRDKWVNEYQIAELKLIYQPEAVTTELWIAVDLSEQVMVVYEGEQPVFATLVSSGIDAAPTREGVYPISFRREVWSMDSDGTSSEIYSLEDVPFAMFFDEGRAFHAVYWHNDFGYPTSQGCVTLSLTDARWLYQRVADEMGTAFTVSTRDTGGPAVFIYSS